MFCDGISFCPNEKCTLKTCKRNQANIRDHTIPHSYFVDTPEDCPRILEKREKEEEKKRMESRKFCGHNHESMDRILDTMCKLEDRIELSEEEEEAFDIAIQCVTCIMNRMTDDRGIEWDD